jgi:hypothetical protein
MSECILSLTGNWYKTKTTNNHLRTPDANLHFVL